MPRGVELAPTYTTKNRSVTALRTKNRSPSLPIAGVHDDRISVDRRLSLVRERIGGNVNQIIQADVAGGVDAPLARVARIH